MNFDKKDVVAFESCVISEDNQTMKICYLHCGMFESCVISEDNQTGGPTL